MTPHSVTSAADPGFDLRGFLLLIWSQKRTVVALTLATTIVAGVSYALTEKRYRASARIYSDQRSDAAVSTEAMIRYRAYLKDAPVAGVVFKQLGLDTPPLSMTEQRFREAIAIRPSDWGTIVVDVSLSDPAMASRAAEALARRLLEVVRAQDQALAETAQQLLQDGVEKAERDLASARQLIVEYRWKNPESVELTAQDRASMNRTLQDLQIEIPAARARLALTEEALAKVPATVTLKIQPLPQGGDAGGAPSATSTFLTEQVNPMYLTLSDRVTTQRSEVRSLETKRDQLRSALSLAQAAGRAETEKRAESEGRFAELQDDLAHFQRNRDQLREALSTARRDRATAKSGLQFLDQGVDMAQPEGLSLPATLIRGIAIGLLLSIVGVALWNMLRAQ